MEREFYVHLEDLAVPDAIKQWYMTYIHQFSLKQLKEMISWDAEDFIRHYEYQDLRTQPFALSDEDILKDIEKITEYLMDSEEKHYQECLGDGDADDHIYLSAYNVFEWLRSKKVK